jgi:hypothetical protein
LLYLVDAGVSVNDDHLIIRPKTLHATDSLLGTALNRFVGDTTIIECLMSSGLGLSTVEVQAVILI